MDRRTALAREDVGAAIFAEVMLDTPIRVFTGVGEIEVAGRTWTGTGAIGRITAVEIGEEISARAFQVGLRIGSEVGEENFETLIQAFYADRTEPVKGRAVRAYVGAYVDGVLVENRLTLEASGIGSRLVLTVDRESAELVLECEQKIAAAFPARSQFLIDADQRAIYPADVGLEFVGPLASGGRIGIWAPGA